MIEMPTVVIAATGLLLVASSSTNAGEEANVDTRKGLQGQRVVIDGVDRYRVCEPLFECVRVALAQRGDNFSPAYIQGLSGAAFRIAGICPCAPTCSFAMWTHELPKLLGYEVNHITLKSCGVDWKKLVELAKKSKPDRLAGDQELEDPELRELRAKLLEVLSAVKQEVRRGRPVILWHAFTNAEFDVVTGFDETTGRLIGRGTYVGNCDKYAELPQFRTLTAAYIGGWPAAIIIGERKTAFDARRAELAALREAVRHAKSTKNHPKLGSGKWVFLEGLSCYDRWISGFEKPDHKRGTGDAYCYGIYRDTHRAASAFLREIAPRYPAARTQLDQAAGHFLAEADTLKEAEPLLWWKSPEGPDRDRNARVVKILQKAREQYAAGIEGIELALAQIEANSEPKRESLETKRLVIRRFASDDWVELQKLAVNKESSEFGKYDHRWPTSEEGCKGMAGYFSKNEPYWAVCLKDGGRIIGLLALNDVDEHGDLDLGHVFHTDFVSDDHDTEALRCIMDYAFANLDIRSIYCNNAQEWTSQLAPLKKLGLKLKPRPKGPVNKSSFQKDENGNPIEFVGCRMAITKVEWLSRSKKPGPKASKHTRE